MRQRLSIRRAGGVSTVALAAIVAIALAGSALPAQAVTPVKGEVRKGSAKKQKKRNSKPRPMYWGAWIGDQLTGTQPPWDMSAVSHFEGLVSRGLSLLSISSPFANCSERPCSFYDFPAKEMNSIRAYGAIPFFNWSAQSTPADPTVPGMPDYQLSDLIAGTYDEYIREFATDAKGWGHPFFLRFNWEMNGNWFPWSEGVNGNKPGEFVAAWRHVHDIFSSVGATNATWVWCPYTEVDRKFAPLKPLYPGSDYVDWTCLDGYNWAENPTNPHPWRSFGQIFGPTYELLTKTIAPDKPVILAEMASTGGHRAKATWIRNMFKQLATKFRRIRGLIWFDQVDRGIDWPLETSPMATRAFAKGVNHPAYKPNIFAGLATSPIRPPR